MAGAHRRSKKTKVASSSSSSSSSKLYSASACLLVLAAVCALVFRSEASSLYPLSTAEATPIPHSCGATFIVPSDNRSATWTLGEAGEADVSIASLNGAADRPDMLQIMKPSKQAQADMPNGDEPYGSVAMSAVISNFRRKDLLRYWDDGTAEGMFSGPCVSMGDCSTNSYNGHKFNFFDKDTKELIVVIAMRTDSTYYIIPPETDSTDERVAQKYKEALNMQTWRLQYYREHGRHWLSAHGRPGPSLNMWPAEAIGQTHTVRSPHGFWREDGTQSAEVAVVNLTVISRGPQGPRTFLIRDLMSEAECDNIVKEGQKRVSQSTVGNNGQAHTSRTRTSAHAFIPRTTTPLLASIHKRFADVLGLPTSVFEVNGGAEQLQVVRYENTQQYMPHHDFEVGKKRARFLTLLLYISPPEAGGATSFPVAAGGRGLRVRPPKGSGVLFYSMLPDGNGDHLSLHAGEPITAGEKWVCNLWVWDGPSTERGPHNSN